MTESLLYAVLKYFYFGKSSPYNDYLLYTQIHSEKTTYNKKGYIRGVHGARVGAKQVLWESLWRQNRRLIGMLFAMMRTGARQYLLPSTGTIEAITFFLADLDRYYLLALIENDHRGVFYCHTACMSKR